MSSPELRRCEGLWFPDGSLVVRADTMMFRVYRGMLANASSVFSDMLAFPQPEGAEIVEGCPVVVMPDSSTDARHFLGVLNDYNYYETFCKDDPFVVYSVLRLATKYDVAPLRDRLVAFFTKVFPASRHLSAWDQAEERRPRGRVDTELDILAVKVARELNVPSILPSALLRCTLSPLDRIIKGVTVDDGRHAELDTPDKLLCLAARERLAGLLRPTLLRWAQEAPSPDDWPTRCSNVWCRTVPGVLSTKVLAGDPDYTLCLLSPWGERGMLDVMLQFADECEQGCEEALSERYGRLRRKTWAQIPSLFGFENWAAVSAATS